MNENVGRVWRTLISELGSLRTVWSIEGVTESLGLHRKLCLEKKNQKTKPNKKTRKAVAPPNSRQWDVDAPVPHCVLHYTEPV